MVEIKLPGLEGCTFESHRDGKVAQWAALEAAVNTPRKRYQVEQHSISLKIFLENLYGLQFRVYRGVAHYNPDSGMVLEVGPQDESIDLDFLVMVQGLHPEILESLTEQEIQALSYIGPSAKDGAKAAKSKKKDSKRLRGLLNKKDGNKLYNIIRNEGENPNYSHFRGGLSELGVIKAMELALDRVQGTGPEEIIFIPNYHIPSRGEMVKDKKMAEDATPYTHREVDGIFIFYSKERFRELLNTLKEYFPTTLKVNYNGTLTS
jgi:hypothetical protein